MTFDECYGFWKYFVRVYNIIKFIGDKNNVGREMAGAWYTRLKKYSKEDVYRGFNELLEDHKDDLTIPSIPLLESYIIYYMPKEPEPQPEPAKIGTGPNDRPSPEQTEMYLKQIRECLGLIKTPEDVLGPEL